MIPHDNTGFTTRNRSGTVVLDNDGVAQTVQREMRLLHLSDIPSGLEECFGGDTMGHWNVARVNRILDAMNAPIVAMPIPRDVMFDMAKVGAPAERKAMAFAGMGSADMPPLSFISIARPGKPDRLSTMLVDGHHRMMALWLLRADMVPARVLPAALAADVQIVEMIEAAVFPRALRLTREVDVVCAAGSRRSA